MPVPLAGPVTRKPPWMYARAGFWPNLSSPLVLPLHAACTLQMVGAAEAGWNTVWEAPGFGHRFSAASGQMKSEPLVVATQLGLPPTAPPPLSKMLAGLNVARAFESVDHGRHLTQVSASTVDELTAAIDDGTIDKIVLAEGTYELTSDMCSASALCISRAVTIEAEVAGGVVLDGMGGRRVFIIESGGTAELIGLNITGGYASVCLPFAVGLGSITPLERYVVLAFFAVGRRAVHRRHGNAD